MNQELFKTICEGAAFALGGEASSDDDRYGFSIDHIDVVLVMHADEETDTIACYVDLGTVAPQDRSLVCEQLLELNLTERNAYRGFHAFDIGSARAMFCAHLPHAEVLDGAYVANMLRLLVARTEAARRMVASPSDYAAPLDGEDGDLLMTAMA